MGVGGGGGVLGQCVHSTVNIKCGPAWPEKQAVVLQGLISKFILRMDTSKKKILSIDTKKLKYDQKKIIFVI